MELLFTYWESFCRQLQEAGVQSVTAAQVKEGQAQNPYLVLKHDVETNVSNALTVAAIEAKYGHRGSYYVQAYLLKEEKNLSMLRQMQAMGHEISYHYDVLDSAGGDLPKAMEEFAENCRLFTDNGFSVETLCQHGNPVVVRKGYSSNRDFFRSAQVQQAYPAMADIMVDFPEKAQTDYLYFSDAGRKFHLIYDPFENDRVDSSDKNIPFDSLQALWQYGCDQKANAIISIHPHRYVASRWKYVIKAVLFRCIRATAQCLRRVPVLEALMSKFYFLAKKF